MPYIFWPDLDNITKKNATPIFGKNHSNIFSRNCWPIAMEFDLSQTMRAHHSLFNYDPGLTLTYFTPRSNLVA